MLGVEVSEGEGGLWAALQRKHRWLEAALAWQVPGGGQIRLRVGLGLKLKRSRGRCQMAGRLGSG